MPRADTEAMSALAVEPWEIHSELVLVSPEVCARARELLPARDPEAFLSVVRESGRVGQPAGDSGLPVAVLTYTAVRLAETARSALFVLGAVVGLASLAEFLH